MASLKHLVVIFLLGGTAVEARADKGDWNQYLEPPGAKPPAIKHTEMASPVAAKPAKATPAPKKQPQRVAQRAKPKKR
ncbi:MAG TPA: hypothetical protein VGM39_05700 [Kofleriaceae bacterium]